MLTPDKVRYENGVKICEKIIPDNAVSYKSIASWVPKGGKMKPGGTMVPIGITLHNTQDLPNVNDDAEQYTRATYPNCNMGGVVVHYYVDDVSAWQNLRENEPGWHASDGNGDGNRRTIAIECIMDGSGSKEDLGARDNAARLIAAIMKRYNWNLSNLYTHNHWMKQPDKIVPGVRKNCPIYILPKYDEFKTLVQKYLDNKEVTSKPAEDLVQPENIVSAPSSNALDFNSINVGDILNFTGNKQYVSSGAKSYYSSAKPSTVKVTVKSRSNYAHPIHVRSVNTSGEFISGVYGWVDINDLSTIIKVPFKVKVTDDSLNIRKGPGVSYPIKAKPIKDFGVYTIVEVVNGWGLLKSYQKTQDGWINLSYTKKL